MARIAGVDLPPKKRAEIGLTYIYGIGRTRSKSLLHRAGIDANKKVGDLTEEEVNTSARFSKTKARWKAISARKFR
jgi:small subunit ribosomal protein S13